MKSANTLKFALPLYGELKSISSSQNNVLSVFVFHVVHVLAIDPHQGIAYLKTSFLGQTAEIHLETKSQPFRVNYILVYVLCVNVNTGYRRDHILRYLHKY